MTLHYLCYSVICFVTISLILATQVRDVNAIIVENNPFYGLSNAEIKTVESSTDDNLINIKLEYAPQALQIGSPEFFKATLFYKDTNEVVKHADTDIVISKDGNELFNTSSEYRQPFVHTPNGIVLSSYRFPEAGQYVITVKILGINFMPVNTKQVNFSANVTESNDKHLIGIGR